MTKPTLAIGVLLLLAASGRKSKILLTLATVLMPLALIGCVSFSSSSPSPPAKNTTIIAPPPTGPAQPY
jgi:hypothetical protein